MALASSLPRRPVSVILIFSLLFCLASARTAAEWRSRTIYQLLTDRFARTDGSTAPCPNLGNYCGGTFQGIIQHLDYLQNLGIDAIWISPVIVNTPGGYHGYWAQDLFHINPYFGTSKDLKLLVAECHKRDIWVMVDVVANHMGPVGYNYSSLVPFNQPSQYHDCSPCPADCNINFNLGNQTQVELCRLSGLPDLNQTVPYVRDTLLNWIKALVKTYDLDGIRIDTVPEIEIGFWPQFQAAASEFAIGEVYDGRVSYVAPYQGPLNSVLSYPLYFTLMGCFKWKQSLFQLQNMLLQWQSAFQDPSVLGTFIDNHDQRRFLADQPDPMLYQNALTYLLTAQGIPILYYGDEQNFDGGTDPANREPLWTTAYDTTGETFKLIQTLIQFRKKAQIQVLDQTQRYADDTFYAFTRGTACFVALTNVGAGSGSITRQITYQPWADGTRLCNIFWGDCVTVQDGSFEIYLDHGESKVLVPTSRG